MEAIKKTTRTMKGKDADAESTQEED